MWDPYSQFTSHKLSNGLNIWKLHLSGRPWEKVRVIVHTGHSSDPVGKDGLAHFCEHLVCAQYSTSSDELQGRFESLGGSADFGVTGPDCTFYEFSAPLVFGGEDTLSWAFGVYGDLLSHPATLLPSEIKDVEKERKIVVSEFHRKFPMAWQYPVHANFRSNLYPGLWQSRVTNGLGSLDSIAQFTEEDVVDFFRKWYTPSNMTIVSVGGATEENICEIINRQFGSLQSSGNNRPPRVISKDVPLPLCNEMVVSVGSVTRSAISSYALMPVFVSSSIVAIVDEMLSKSVFEDVRQKRHLAYSATASATLWNNCMEVKISATGVSPDAEPVVRACFLEDIQRVVSDRNLFEQAQQYLIARKSMIDPNGNSFRSNAGEDIAYFGRVISLTEEVAELKNVTHDDIRSLVDLWLVPERFLTLVTKP